MTYTHCHKIKDASYALGDDNTINGWHDARQRCLGIMHNMTIIADVYNLGARVQEATLPVSTPGR